MTASKIILRWKGDMRIHCIIHDEFELPGYYATWCSKKGFEMKFVHVKKPCAFPAHTDYDALLLMGGTQNAKKLHQYPYLINELAFIKQAIEYNKKIIGVCLGAQLLGECYGAKTEKSPHREIGVFPVTLTNAGKNDPLFRHFPNIFLSGHWHDDMPGLPSSTTILAESAGCPRQIVKYSDSVYGLQCHLEFTKSCVTALLNSCNNQLKSRTYVQSPQEILSNDYNEVNKNLHIFLEHFLCNEQ